MTITIDLPTWEYAIRAIGGAMMLLAIIAIICLIKYLFFEIKYVIHFKTIRQILIGNWKAGNIHFHSIKQPWYLQPMKPKQVGKGE